MIRPVTEFRNRHIKLFQGGPICQGSKYVSTFLVGVFKTDDLGVIFYSPIPPSFLNNVTYCFPDWSWIKGYLPVSLTCVNGSGPLCPNIRHYSSHAIMPRKRAFREGFPEKRTTTEACDETAQHVNYYKLLSFCDKRVRGRKENYLQKRTQPLIEPLLGWRGPTRLGWLEIMNRRSWVIHW